MLVTQPEALDVLVAKAGIPDSRFTFKFATHLKCCHIFTISSNYGPPNISPRIGYRRSIPEENDIVQDSPAWHLDHETTNPTRGARYTSTSAFQSRTPIVTSMGIITVRPSAIDRSDNTHAAAITQVPISKLLETVGRYIVCNK